MNDQLEKTGEALNGYLKQCVEDCDKAQKIIEEKGDPSSIDDLAREVIVLGKHLAQFEHMLSGAYQVTKRMAQYVTHNPRLLLEVKQVELEVLEYTEAVHGREMLITEDLRDEIWQLKKKIQTEEQ